MTTSNRLWGLFSDWEEKSRLVHELTLKYFPINTDFPAERRFVPFSVIEEIERARQAEQEAWQVYLDAL